MRSTTSEDGVLCGFVSRLIDTNPNWTGSPTSRHRPLYFETLKLADGVKIVRRHGRADTLLTDTYTVGIELYDQLQAGRSLCETLTALGRPFDRLGDGYPSWRCSFEGLLSLSDSTRRQGTSRRKSSQRPPVFIRRMGWNDDRREDRPRTGG